MPTALTIEGFDNVEYLGQGGLSIVYRARQTAFDRTVALKVLRIGSEDRDAMRAFEKECTAAGRLAWHPNVVSVIDRGVVDGHLYLVMEYYSGGTLAEEIQRRGALPLDEVLALGIKLCGALGTAHAEGVLHRDIKPQNVLLSNLGEPALSDFGLSAVAGQSATTTGAGFSPAFSPPEVYSGALPTVRGDIYSLAATLFHAACGRAPFGRDGATIASVVGDVMGGRVAPFPPAVADTPLAPILTRALSVTPADRYADAAEFAAAMQQVQLERGWTPTVMPTSDMATIPPDRLGEHGVLTPVAATGSESPASRPLLSGRALAGALTGAAVLAGVIGFAVRSADPAEEAATLTTTSTTTEPTADPCVNPRLINTFDNVLAERQLGRVEGERADVPEGCVLRPRPPGANEVMLGGAAALSRLDGAPWSNLGSQGVMDAPAVVFFGATNLYPGADCWALELPSIVIVDDARTLWTQDRYTLAVNFFDMATESDALGSFMLNSLVSGTAGEECSGFDDKGLARWPAAIEIDYQDVPVAVDGVRINTRSTPGIRALPELSLGASDHLYKAIAQSGSRVVTVDVVSRIGPVTETRISTFLDALLSLYFPAE